MDLVLQIVLGIVALSTFFFAYKSWANWGIVNILLVMAIFFAGGGFFYLAARTLKTQAAWRAGVREYEKAVAAEKATSLGLLEGIQIENQERTVGIVEAKRQLSKLALERGEVWLSVLPGKVKPDTGGVMIAIENPDPHGVPDKASVFIFAPPVEKNKPAKYLGKFKVIAAANKSIEVAPHLPMTPPEIQRLSRTPGPWNIHLMMPIDDPEVFASMVEQDRRQFLEPLPKTVQADFAKKTRKPRDYEALFDEQYFDRVLLDDAIATATSDLERLTAANKQAAEDIAYRATEKGNLQSDLKQFQYERDKTKEYFGKLQKQLAGLKAALKRLVMDNRKLAAELKDLQLKIAERINRQAAEAEAQAKVDAEAPGVSR